MAEQFVCGGETIHFTNGACRELYITWSKCASLLEHQKLVKVLNVRVNMGPGCKAEGIDEDFLSEDLCDANIKGDWLATMSFLINDMIKCGEISENMDVNWSPELRETWLSKLVILRDTLNKQLSV
jgi:hypothetical protein